MAYQYVAYTPQGEKIQGRVDAATEGEAEAALWKQNYTVVALKETRKSGESQLFVSKIKTRDLAVFSRQLATLIESGIPIIRGLLLLQEQAPSKRFRQVLADVIVEVQQGRFFSEAIAKHGKVFPDIYPRLIEVGERAGNLEIVLRQLATYMEKEEELVRKIRGGMAYPSFVLLMAIGVAVLLITVALPPLMDMFTVFDAELPLPTRVLMALTDFTTAYRKQLLAGVLLTIAAAIMFVRSKTGRVVLDRMVLKVPLVGAVVIQGAVARMCRSTSTLLQAGIALPEIMDLVTRSQGNSIVRSALEQVHRELLEGHGLADPLAQRKVFPGLLVQMVRVGEETGSLDTNMDTLAIFYEDETSRTVDALTGAMGPALTIFIGVIVGFVALAVIMPMYSLMGNLE